MTKQIVRCDESCGRGTRMNIRVLNLPQGKQETYFNCEHCGHKYTCYITDSKARQLQKKMRKTRNPLEKFYLQVQLKERMAKLKEELV